MVQQQMSKRSQDPAAELMRRRQQAGRNQNAENVLDRQRKSSNKTGIKRTRKKQSQNPKETEEKQAKQQSSTDSKMSSVALLFFLPLAVVSDLLSLLPYIGMVVSVPFAIVFFVYKFMAGLRWTAKVTTTLADLGAEVLLSSLPGNTTDVILTYVISNKMDKITEKIPTGTSKKPQT